MKIRVSVSNKTVYEGDHTQLIKEISSRSWEGYSSFAVRYEPDQDTLVVEYWGEWPWLHVGDGKEIKLF